MKLTVFPHFQVMSNELSTPRILLCPEDPRRSDATNFTTDFNDSHINYFIGVDASKITTNALLSGDANFTLNSTAPKGLLRLVANLTATWPSKIHDGKGHILTADGHVKQVSSADLQAQLRLDAATTNRLVIP